MRVLLCEREVFTRVKIPSTLQIHVNARTHARTGGILSFCIVILRMTARRSRWGDAMCVRSVCRSGSRKQINNINILWRPGYILCQNVYSRCLFNELWTRLRNLLIPKNAVSEIAILLFSLSAVIFCYSCNSSLSRSVVYETLKTI